MIASKRAVLVLAASLIAMAAHAAETTPPMLVFAAASLSDVLEDLGAAWRRSTGVPVRFSFAASSLLARQIEAGGRADVFISADREWMDYLDDRGLIVKSSRHDLAANRLVLIAPADSTLALEMRTGLDLATALGNGRLSLADPDTVPAGRYARAALDAMGVWRQVEGRLARADNVRAALVFVARGETPLGIVYATDARIEKNVRVVAFFPAHSHPPISYPAAATPDARPDAAAFIAYLRGKDAAAVWKKHGFLEPAD